MNLAPSDRSPAATAFCQNCGTEQAEVAQFCRKCGLRLATTPSDATVTQTLKAAAESDDDGAEQGRYFWNTSDYGPPTMPPSPDAEVARSSLTEEEKQILDSLLREWQSISDGSIFHPEFRACMWGHAFCKLAEVYREKGIPERALLLMENAWRISRYPMLAYKAGLLSLSLGRRELGVTLLKEFLRCDPKTLTNAAFKLISDMDGVTADTLSGCAEIARNRISAENQTGTPERSASTMPHAPAMQTPREAAESVAQLIGETFSSSRFTELFKDESFADGWKLGDALAVWYFLGTVSLDVAVWTTFDSRNQAPLIVDTCHSLLSRRWNMSESVLERFNTVMQTYGKAAFFAYVGCKSDADWFTLFSRFANLILGAKFPADHPFEGTTMEGLLKGYEPVSLDASLGLPICALFTDTTITAKKLLQEPAIAWPASTRE
jgi:hypothetical protein